jgi:hypothetical protein
MLSRGSNHLEHGLAFPRAHPQAMRAPSLQVVRMEVDRFRASARSPARSDALASYHLQCALDHAECQAHDNAKRYCMVTPEQQTFPLANLLPSPRRWHAASRGDSTPRDRRPHPTEEDVMNSRFTHRSHRTGASS